VNRHLRTDEISKWLLNERTPEMEQHTGSCAECQAAVDRLERTLNRFRGAVTSFADEQLLSLKPVVISQRRRASQGFGLKWAAAAAMLLVVTAVPIWRGNLNHRRAAELERQDDLLLQQVQTDAYRSVPEPMEPLANLVWPAQSPAK